MLRRIPSRLPLGLRIFGWLLAASPAVATVDTCVRVEPPIATNGQVLIRFSAEPNVTYFVEHSTNASDWSTEQTNTAPEVVRETLLSVPDPDANSFYRVSRRPLPFLDAALLAAQGITFNGPSNKVDSFNSTNALFSSNGQYDPLKALDSGNIYCASGPVVLTNTAVRGVMRLGSSATSMLDASSLIGDTNWSGPGIQANHVVSNFTIPFPSISAPYTAGIAPPPGIVGGVQYDFVLTGSSSSFPPLDFYVSGLFSGSFIVTSNSNVRLIINGNALINHNCVIEPGARLQLYMMGSTFNLQQNSIENRTKSPNSFIYWGGNSNTNLSIGDGSPFHGFVVAPQATINVRMNPSSTDVLDISGTILGKTINAGSRVAFHADRAFFLLGTGR